MPAPKVGLSFHHGPFSSSSIALDKLTSESQFPHLQKRSKNSITANIVVKIKWDNLYSLFGIILDPEQIVYKSEVTKLKLFIQIIQLILSTAI